MCWGEQKSAVFKAIITFKMLLKLLLCIFIYTFSVGGLVSI